MFISIKLGGTTNDLNTGDSDEPLQQKLPETFPEIDNFMIQHPSAKIVLVVDTHCLQDSGAFICSGDGPKSYAPCTLWEVSALRLVERNFQI